MPPSNDRFATAELSRAAALESAAVKSAASRSSGRAFRSPASGYSADLQQVEGAAGMQHLEGEHASTAVNRGESERAMMVEVINRERADRTTEGDRSMDRHQSCDHDAAGTSRIRQLASHEHCSCPGGRETRLALGRSAELAAAAPAVEVEIEVELSLTSGVQTRRDFKVQQQHQQQHQQRPIVAVTEVAVVGREEGASSFKEEGDVDAVGRSFHRSSTACSPPGSSASSTSEAGGRRASTRCGDGSKTFVSHSKAAATEMFQLEGERDIEVGLGFPSPFSRASSTSNNNNNNHNRGGQRPSKGATGDVSSGNNIEDLPPFATAVVFDVSNDGVGVESAKAAAAVTAARVLPDVARALDSDLLGGRPDMLPLTGRSGGGNGSRAGDMGSSCDYGGMIGPESPVSQALHVALAFVVLVLVAFAKADDGAVRATPYGKGAGYSGSSGTTVRGGSGSIPSRTRGSRTGGGGKGGVGRDPSQRNSGTAPTKRRKIAGSEGASGGGVLSSPIVRRLRAAWSKLWHFVEDDLETRWRAAGRVLTSLRKAWSALWMPPPHVEADILAEALASPPRYSQAAAERRRSKARGGDSAGGSGVGSVGGGGGGSESRRPWFRRVSGSRSSRGAIGAADSSLGEKALCLGRPVGLNWLNFLSLCGCRPWGGKGSRQAKFLLLLDLDETLVHCSAHLMQPARRRSGGGGARGGAPRPDLELEMRSRVPSDNRPWCMYAWKRPHLDIFLGVVSRWYEVAVFTSGQRCFAEPLIDLIDSRCVIGKRFYRDSCVRRDGGSSAVGRAGDSTRVAAAGVGPPGSSGSVKDLRVVRSEHFPLRTVIVDNQPRTVLQQANVLPVKSWFPRDTEDRQLLDLLPILLALTSCKDVRSVLGLRPGVGDGGSQPVRSG